MSNTYEQGVLCYGTDGTHLFAGTFENGLLSSLDSGKTWQTLIGSQRITSVFYDNGSLYAGTTNSGLLRSHDAGLTWPDTLLKPQINYVVRSGPNLIAGAFGPLFLSTNNGDSWLAILNDGSSSLYASNGHDIYANSGKFLYHSIDNGQTWDRTGSVPTSVYDLAIIGDRLFLSAGSGHNTKQSLDGGATWTLDSAGLPDDFLFYIHRFAIVGQSLVAASNYGAFVTTNLGASWSPMNTGLRDLYLWPMTPVFGYLYSGGDTEFVRYPLSQVPQGSNDVANQQVKHSSISCYPNPATSSTRIDFESTSAGAVTIQVMDVLGKIVSSKSLCVAAGNQTYTWSRPEGLSPGIYRCLVNVAGIENALNLIVQ